MVFNPDGGHSVALVKFTGLPNKCTDLYISQSVACELSPGRWDYATEDASFFGVLQPSSATSYDSRGASKIINLDGYQSIHMEGMAGETVDRKPMLGLKYDTYDRSAWQGAPAKFVLKIASSDEIQVEVFYDDDCYAHDEFPVIERQGSLVPIPFYDTDDDRKLYLTDRMGQMEWQPITYIENNISSTTSIINLSDGTGYIYNYTNPLQTLQVTTGAKIPLDLNTQVNFTSGSTPTVITASSNVMWIGDNVSETVGFVPRANCRYTIAFMYDGINVRGIVQGISL